MKSQIKIEAADSHGNGPLPQAIISRPLPPVPWSVIDGVYPTPAVIRTSTSADGRIRIAHVFHSASYNANHIAEIMSQAPALLAENQALRAENAALKARASGSYTASAMAKAGRNVVSFERYPNLQ